MDKVTKKNVIDVLKKSLLSVRKRDVSVLKMLSNRLIHIASVNQDEDSVAIAIVLYSLYKIYSRSDYFEMKSWSVFNRKTLDFLRVAREMLLKGDFVRYRNVVNDYLRSADKLDSRLKRYVSDVINDAKISKGSRLYEHGISAGRTSEVLGISKFDLMGYVGGTGIADVSIGKNVMERLNRARGLFR